MFNVPKAVLKAMWRAVPKNPNQVKQRKAFLGVHLTQSDLGDTAVVTDGCYMLVSTWPQDYACESLAVDVPAHREGIIVDVKDWGYFQKLLSALSNGIKPAAPKLVDEAFPDQGKVKRSTERVDTTFPNMPHNASADIVVNGERLLTLLQALVETMQGSKEKIVVLSVPLDPKCQMELYTVGQQLHTLGILMPWNPKGILRPVVEHVDNQKEPDRG